MKLSERRKWVVCALIHSRKFPSQIGKSSQKSAHGPQSEEESSHRTFGVGEREVQLLDLRGPRHGRQHLEGVLAVDLLAVANVELQQSPKHLEVLELACMRPRGREVEKRVGSALSATPKNGKLLRKSGLVRNSERNLPPEDSPVTWRHP